MSRGLSPTIKCEICYNRYKSLAGHLKKHKYTAKKYKKEFDKPTVSPLTHQRMRLARLRYVLKRKVKPKKYATERARKIALASTGKKHSPETKEKIRRALTGSKFSEAHKLAISAGLLGHKVSDATREKLRNVVITDEQRKQISRAQSAEKGNSWKGGISRHLYFGKNKYRFKRIFGEPLRCFYPECDKVEGENMRSVDCHHVDNNHENNPLDGSNWLPLCRRHHMLADGRLKNATPGDIKKAQKVIKKVHVDFMKNHYVGEIKTYHD